MLLAGLRMHQADALPAMVQVFHLKKKKHLLGRFRVLPKVFEVHALLCMLTGVFFKLLPDVCQFCAVECC